MAGGARGWLCRDRMLDCGERPLIMGILNVTPDSFSDGGQYAEPEPAIARGLAMAAEGADIIDIGGESTRPGAAPVPEAEELRRILPVLRGLSRVTTAALSVDTRKAGVAQEAIGAGAHILNDVSALRSDPAMAAVARATGAGVVLMHMRGEPGTMQQDPRYEDVVAEVCAFLEERLRYAEAQGVDPRTLAIDPGIGFGKTVEHNVRLLAGLSALARCGRPVVVGVSRKRFIGAITGREVCDRLAGTLAAEVFALLGGAQVVRVHDVRETADAIKMVTMLRREARACPG